MKDKLIFWSPLDEWPKELFVKAVNFDSYGLRVILDNNDLEEQNKELVVTLNYYVSYRVTDESYLLKIWHTVNREILGHVFYRIENSSYVDFIKEMRMGFDIEDKVCYHYAIYAYDLCVDIITYSPPIVELRLRGETVK